MNKSAADLIEMQVTHIGINADSGEQAVAWAAVFLKLMGIPTRQGE